MKKIFQTIILSSFIVFSFMLKLNAQGIDADKFQVNTLTTAVPFLMITPDARSAGMADVGVSNGFDVFSSYWNVSKLAFAEEKSAIGFAYTPWLSQITNDMYLANMSWYQKINQDFTLTSSFRYFSLGEINFTDQNGGSLDPGNPNEFALDFGAAYGIGKNFSLGMAFRYIFSNLASGYGPQNDIKPGQSFAADISALIKFPDINISDKKSDIYLGINISNIGNKMDYGGPQGQKSFLPTNLKIGPSWDIQLDKYNSLVISADFNKLLVPTPPVYASDVPGSGVTSGTSEDIIVSGMDPDRGVINAMFTSFSDAPGIVSYNDINGTYNVESGSVFKEEMSEFQWSVAAEYWYGEPKIFAFRAGYFFESPTKGNRKYVSFGAGFRYKVLQIDLSYLIPTVQNNPLANTLRLDLIFNLDKSKQKQPSSEE
jgi:hypothetical protein